MRARITSGPSSLPRKTSSCASPRSVSAKRTSETRAPPPARGRGRIGAFSTGAFIAREDRSLVLGEHVLGDDHPLDLRGALVDLQDLRVAHQLLDRVVLHVPDAAEDLH